MALHVGYKAHQTYKTLGLAHTGSPSRPAFVAKMLAMDWIIERIDATEQAVYLRKLSSGTRRRICVPGAMRAGWQAELLFIEARTGFVWLVEP